MVFGNSKLYIFSFGVSRIVTQNFWQKAFITFPSSNYWQDNKIHATIECLPPSGNCFACSLRACSRFIYLIVKLLQRRLLRFHQIYLNLFNTILLANTIQLQKRTMQTSGSRNYDYSYRHHFIYNQNKWHF